jgi:hypothetical protein
MTMEIVNQDAESWLRAHEVAGVELPGDIIEARDNLARVEEERAALPGVEIPKPARLVSEGLSLEEATATVQKAESEAARWAESRDIVTTARDIARTRLNRLVKEHRDDLIVGARPVVDAIIEQARPLSATLADFAPDYPPAALVRKGNAKQLTAYQKSEELEGKFGTIMAAHRASMKAAGRGGQPHCDLIRGARPVDKFWANPGLVVSNRLNGTRRNQFGKLVAIQPRVLSVAAEDPEAGFRLASVQDLIEVEKAARHAVVEEHRANRLGRKTFGARSV